MRSRGWTLLGIDFHWRWREGRTILDLRNDSVLVHHGLYTLEWARGPHIEYFRGVRAAFQRSDREPAKRSDPVGGAR